MEEDFLLDAAPHKARGLSGACFDKSAGHVILSRGSCRAASYPGVLSLGTKEVCEKRRQMKMEMKAMATKTNRLRANTTWFQKTVENSLTQNTFR